MWYTQVFAAQFNEVWGKLFQSFSSIGCYLYIPVICAYPNGVFVQGDSNGEQGGDFLLHYYP